MAEEVPKVPPEVKREIGLSSLWSMYIASLATIADSLGLPCIVGTEIEPGISLIAKLHLAASMKNHHLASEFTELSLLKANVLKHNLKVEDGCLTVPDGPGFGVDIDEGIFNKYIL